MRHYDQRRSQRFKRRGVQIAVNVDEAGLLQFMLGKQRRTHPDRQGLAVDEHAVAVEDDEVEGAVHRPAGITRPRNANMRSAASAVAAAMTTATDMAVAMSTATAAAMAVAVAVASYMVVTMVITTATATAMAVAVAVDIENLLDGDVTSIHVGRRSASRITTRSVVPQCGTTLRVVNCDAERRTTMLREMRIMKASRQTNQRRRSGVLSMELALTLPILALVLAGAWGGRALDRGGRER